MENKQKSAGNGCGHAAKILADDNNTIIARVDGSRVLYDKENPRTEIIIQELKET